MYGEVSQLVKQKSEVWLENHCLPPFLIGSFYNFIHIGQCNGRTEGVAQSQMERKMSIILGLLF